jgi:hypothetical protein
MKKLILISLILCGCTVTKDRNAVARVTYNPTLFNQVGRQWQLANPCSIDTVRQFINGKEVVRYDTLFNIDTAFNPVTQIKTVYETVTKLVNKTDTLVTYITDQRAVNLVKDDLNKATGQISQLQTDLKASQTGSTKKTWWIVGISIFSVLAIGGLTFLLFKK